ncbi:hypothetical protein D3C86_2136200 [compost metagenome]
MLLMALHALFSIFTACGFMRLLLQLCGHLTDLLAVAQLLQAFYGIVPERIVYLICLQ